MHVSSHGGGRLKLAAAIFLAFCLVVLVQACGIFGGGDDSFGGNQASLARPSSIPTATPPATLPEPILLGSTTDVGGTPPAARGTPGAGGTPAAGSGTYVVKTGDTLAGIAASQGVTGPDQASWIQEVLRLNNLADARLLAVGQELSLPRSAAANTTPRAGTPQATSASPTPGAGATATPRPNLTPGTGRTYTVVSGDSPNGIATKLGVPSAQQTQWVQQLLQMNNTTAATLQVGQVLQLPPIPGA